MPPPPSGSPPDLLRAVTVERYRSFREPTRIEFRPLTMLFGQNNSGKSALLRVLPLLRDTVNSRGTSPLNLASPAVRGASFEDLLCQQDPKQLLGLTLESDRATVAYDIRGLERRIQVVERLTTTKGGGRSLLWTLEDGVWANVSLPKESELRPQFTGLSYKLPGEQEVDPPAAHDLSRVLWLDSVRARAPRRVPYGARLDETLASDGGNAPSILGFARLDRSPVYDEVQRFFRERLGHDLVVQATVDDLRVRISPLGRPAVSVDLCDTGEGLAQVLPVTVALAQAAQDPRRPLVALEQPELHLHPRLHERLAEWVCEIVAGGAGPRVVMETHSENVLLRVMLAIAERVLQPDDVIVYWVQQLGDGRSTVSPVTFDSRAIPIGMWPPDVFSEDAVLAMKLNKLRLTLK